MRTRIITSLAACIAAIIAGTQVQANSLDNGAPALDAKTLKALKKKYGEGPYPFEIDAYVATHTPALGAQYTALFTEGTRNAVLNQVRIGLAEMDLGNFGAAERAFDGAISQIETIYSNDPRAKQARSTWSKESVKDFKGEPYERAMVYYYRGILYLRAGDYENARASFLAGEFQDSVSEAEEYSADFAALNYLAGFSSQCMGDSAGATELYSKAHQYSPALSAPAEGDNLLFVAELGKAPVKNATGKHDELLAFAPGVTTQDLSASFVLTSATGDQTIPAVAASSVSQQAMTRGGRPIEAVLNGKARFKDGMGAAGEIGQAIGVQAMNAGFLSDNSDLSNAGAIIGLIGMFASMAADAAQPDADTRYWETLPDSIQIASAKRPATGWSATAKFTESGKTQAATSLGDPSLACTVVWTRAESAVPAMGSAPNTTLTASEVRKLQKKYAAADKMFRQRLIEQSPQQPVEAVAQVVETVPAPVDAVAQAVETIPVPDTAQ